MKDIGKYHIIKKLLFFYSRIKQNNGKIIFQLFFEIDQKDSNIYLLLSRSAKLKTKRF